MESNLVRFQTEIANKLQNPTLGNNDKEVGKGKGIVHQNNNGLETTSQTNLMEREKTKTPTPTTANSPKP